MLTATIEGETAAFEEKPIALIVEDKLDALERRRRLFDQYGFQAIVASSGRDALREFRSTPTIDIVVTDINLLESDPHDRSGVQLARDIQKLRPVMPLKAISGHFETLDRDDQKPFNGSLLKGEFGLDKLEARLHEWREEALTYRRGRAEKARDELGRMQRDHEVAGIDVDVLRDFLPGRHAADREPEEPMTPDECVRNLGYHLRLIEAGIQGSEFAECEGAVRTRATIPVWLRREGDATVAVLHGHPCIYVDARDEEEAVAGMLRLMHGYHCDFADAPDTPLSAELGLLRDYLGKIFGGLKHANHQAGRPEGHVEAGDRRDP